MAAPVSGGEEQVRGLGEAISVLGFAWWALGIAALVAVQVAFVGIALWPLIWSEDAFLRHEEVRLVQDASGYMPRWLIELPDGETLKMPPPAGLAFQADAILCVSLVFRSLDEAVCPLVPIGTHPMWHLLNGLMLGWMIEVYRRHVALGRPAPG